MGSIALLVCKMEITTGLVKVLDELFGLNHNGKRVENAEIL